LAEAPPKGECTLVIEGASEQEALDAVAWSDAEVDRALEERLAAGASVKDAAADLVGRTGRARRALYARAVELREGKISTDGSDAL
jgi:16S rRNA (cytidine1402-2'-O)-methyltransferase